MLFRSGDRTLLVVEPRGRPDDRALVAIARSLAWARPEEVVAIRRFPLDRRHDAKVDYPGLRRMLDARRWMLRAPVAHAVPVEQR